VATEKRTRSVYVIALDREVLSKRKFREINPNYKTGKPCVYVGMTGRTPDQRFRQHKANYKACSYVRDYGKYLRRRLYEKYNPMTYDEAVKREVELARELRAKGFAVWQN